MKKLLLSLSMLAFSVWVSGQDCSDLMISEYVEGWNNNKSIEIYNPTPTAIDLSAYRLIRWSNGDVTSDQDIRYVLPLTGSIPSYQVIVMIQDTNFPGQDTMIAPGLKAKANYMAPADYNAGTAGCRVVFWNGDDAISLQKNVSGTWTDIDIVGEIGVRPLNWQGTTDPVGGWDDTAPYADGQGNYLTKDQTLYRKATIRTGINRDEMNAYGPNSFNAFLEYDSLPNNYFDSLGHHTCDCEYLSIHENGARLQASVYPNPVTGQKVLITADFEITEIELFDIRGSLVSRVYLNDRQYDMALPENFGKGVYFVRIHDNKNGFASQKLILF